ncbi:MAG: hypothetical protein WKG01_28115 [Kofleriaceae bacterium]
MKRVLLTLVSGLTGFATLSCGDTTTNPVLQLNLDRPVDIAFACYGGLRLTGGGAATVDQPVVFTAQPTPACDVRSTFHEVGTPIPVAPGQEDLTAAGGAVVPNATWYGFVLQQGPGTVALAQFRTQPSNLISGGPDVLVLDANPLTPGKNSISIGEDPIAIVTDTTGCQAITANAGTCDLSLLDVGTAVDGDPQTLTVQRLDVTNAAGVPIRAKPAAMVSQPATEVIGNSCPVEGERPIGSGLIYIAYPSCHLVAGVDAATGRIMQGIQYDAAGVPTLVDGNVTCPDECSGAAVTAGTRPVALDLEKDPRTGDQRLVIASDNSPSITVVELDDMSSALSLSQVAFENTTGNLGFTKVSLSPQIGMGGQGHVINDTNAAGGQFQFMYGVATDDTVRVADILTLNKECDAQVDPRYLRDFRNIRELSCLVVGDPLTPPRRAGARGPGIELPGESIPVAIDIFRADPQDGDTRGEENPGKLIGYFGVISAADGNTYVLNVDDDDYPDLWDPSRPLRTIIPKAIAHQLRDSVPDRELLAQEDVDGAEQPLCDPNGPPDSLNVMRGGPRSTTQPVRNVPVSVVAPEKTTLLPGIRQLACVGVDSTRAVSEVGYTAPPDIRYQAFPDLRALETEETWTITYEGSLSNSNDAADIDGPAVRESQIAVDASGMRMFDLTRPYCDAGVELFDLVQMRGCDPINNSGDCPSGYSCFVHPNSQVASLGSCMLEDEAERLADACEDYLTTLRRYNVGRVESGELVLKPRKHELRMTPLDGCVSDTQCQDLASYSLRLASSAHPVNDTTGPDTRTWKCEADPDRAPLPPNNKRCTLKCDVNADCALGTVCRGALDGAPKSGTCMEGVIPPQACVNAPQRYELRANEAFTVIGQEPLFKGTGTGYLHPWIANSAGSCVRDPAANRLTVGRIPLKAPACDPTSDPITGELPGGGFEPNPCSTTIEHADVVPQYLPGTCTLGNPTAAIVNRQAPAIRFRNHGMTFHMVDPTYPGDASCIADRGGSLVNIPHVVTPYQISFRQTAGSFPLQVPITPTHPIKVVRGPTQSIWVIDNGDFLSTNVGNPSTRGKVFRVEPFAVGRFSTLQ